RPGTTSVPATTVVGRSEVRGVDARALLGFYAAAASAFVLHALRHGIRSGGADRRAAWSDHGMVSLDRRNRLPVIRCPAFRRSDRMGSLCSAVVRDSGRS